MTPVAVSCRLDITQSAVTKAAFRGEKWSKDSDLQMVSASKCVEACGSTCRPDEPISGSCEWSPR